MKSYEAKAKTKEEAIALGLEELGVSLADVDIEVIDEGKKGVLGILGSKPVVVRLTVKEEETISVVDELFAQPASAEKKPAKKAPRTEAPAKEKPAKAEAPKAEAPKAAPAKAVPQEKPFKKPAEPTQAEAPAEPKAESAEPAPQDGELEAKAYEFVSNVTRLMGVNVTINTVWDEEGNLHVNMFGDTLGILIGRRGETLDSLQYLTGLYVNRGREEYTRVTLDTENYRAKREEALVRLANRMANRAVKTGRKVVMEPMNPYERRILHSALQNHEAVTTHSEGEEPNRHVVITLK